MTYGSAGFVLCALLVLLTSAAAGRARRWAVLLASSYAFYVLVGSLSSVAVLAGVTVVSYLCALEVERGPGTRRSGVFFWIGVVTPLGALGALKYAAFLADNVDALAGAFGRGPLFGSVPVVAAVGMSYFVLQAVSYLIDVRDGAVAAERHLGRHALAFAFFPKVLQGPIERAENLLPQLREPRSLSVEDVAAGARLFVWGLFQKVVVADRLSPFVEAAFADVRHHAGLPLLVATYFFAAQLYFDFAGYTDMALGLSRALGIRLTPNFASPYLARSIAEFWRRWHISLSTWLLDYVFKPLQLGLRDWRTWGTPVALVATFLASGLWHGASWTFVAWGLLHGIYLAASVLFRPWQKKLHALLGMGGSRRLAVVEIAATFHLVCFAWIFFRARSLADALVGVRLLVAELPSTVARAVGGNDLDTLVYLDQGRGAFLAAIAAVVIGGLLRPLVGRNDAPAATEAEGRGPLPLGAAYARTALYAALLYGVVMLGNSAQSFLYAQF